MKPSQAEYCTKLIQLVVSSEREGGEAHTAEHDGDGEVAS